MNLISKFLHKLNHEYLAFWRETPNGRETVTFTEALTLALREKKPPPPDLESLTGHELAELIYNDATHANEAVDELIRRNRELMQKYRDKVRRLEYQVKHPTGDGASVDAARELIEIKHELRRIRESIEGKADDE